MKSFKIILELLKQSKTISFTQTHCIDYRTKEKLINNGCAHLRNKNIVGNFQIFKMSCINFV